MILFELLKNDNFSNAIIQVLVSQGYLRKTYSTEASPIPVDIKPLKIEPQDNVPCDADKASYLTSGRTLESKVEEIAKRHLGVCEDRKLWAKDLRTAVKDYGHDEVLSSFYDWASSFGTFLGKKPITMFLKNTGTHVSSATRPGVTNPNLEKLERHVALMSENRIFFTGDMRVRLAVLLKEYGLDKVVKAFDEFYQLQDVKRMQWASFDFIQRADIIISTIETKEAQVVAQAELLKSTYSAAKQDVELLEEDEDDNEL